MGYMFVCFALCGAPGGTVAGVLAEGLADGLACLAWRRAVTGQQGAGVK